VSADHRRSLPPRVLIEGVEHMAELLGMMHGRLLAWKLGEGRTLRVAPSEMFSDKGALCADEYVGETLVASHIVCKVDALRDHGRKRKSHEIAGAANPKKVYTVCPLDL